MVEPADKPVLFFRTTGFAFEYAVKKYSFTDKAIMI